MSGILLRQLPKATASIASRTAAVSIRDVSNSARFQASRVGRAFATAADPVEAPATQSRALVPPRTAAFREACLNTVTLSGVVVDNPTEVTYQERKTLVKLRLAVPRTLKQMDTENYDFYQLTFFEFSGQQAKRFFPANTKIIVQGHLNLYRGQAEVIVDDCALMEEGSWPYTSTPQSPPPPQQSWGSSDYRQGQEGPRTIIKPYLGRSVLSLHSEYASGKTIEEISQERNYKEPTVLSYLAEAAFHGKQVDLEFLARKCLLGPKGSKYMNTDTIYTAIQAVMKKENIEDLTKIPVTSVIILLRDEIAPKALNVQETILKSVTYSQLATVLAMMKRGMSSRDWNAFRVAEPSASKKDESAPPY